MKSLCSHVRGRSLLVMGRSNRNYFIVATALKVSILYALVADSLPGPISMAEGL